MKYKWNDTIDKIKRLSEKGYDHSKLEKVCQSAAYKIYPVYSSFNIEMGDKTPSVHYLGQIIFELALSQVLDPEDNYSWGGITIMSCEMGEEPGDYYAVNIGYHIESVWLEDLKK